MTSQAPLSKSGSKRYPALDGLRGLAILGVIIAHVVAYAPPPVIHGVLGYGTLGVDLFFVLSGFLITGILYDSRQERGYFRVFYARRALRIAPVYYIALGVYAAVIAATSAAALAEYADVLPWLGLWGANIWIGLHDSWLPFHTSHFWSLAVEEQFYLLWPAVVILVGDRRRLVLVCIGLIVAALGVRAWFLVSGHTLSTYVMLPARMDALAVGSIAALSVRSPGGLPRTDAIARRWLGPLTLAVLFIVLAPELMGFQDDRRARAALLAFSLSFWALLFGACLVRAVATAPRFLEARWLTYTGTISYCAYIVHAAVIALMYQAGARSFLPLLIAVLLATYAISSISWRYVERPLLAKRHRINYGSGGDSGQASEQREPTDVAGDRTR